MAIELKVPTLGESVTEATVAKWFKLPGDSVSVDEPLVELETDKVTLEVNAPVSGALESIIIEEGTDVEVGAVLGLIGESSGGKPDILPEPITQSLSNQTKNIQEKSLTSATETDAPMPDIVASIPEKQAIRNSNLMPLSPAVRKIVEDNGLDPSNIPGTGRDGRLTKGDILKVLEENLENSAVELRQDHLENPVPVTNQVQRPDDPREERVRMTKLRKIIAARLKEAQNTAAMLTTWNEIDLGAVMDLRTNYKEQFENKHGAKLGFMSFFVRACCIALKEWPSINAEVSGEELVYKNYYNIGVAVGTPQGLVVPILKDADQMRFSQIESKIADFGRRARDGKLSMNEMIGGPFTISNGGVFGSLNSMPILNVPQSAILGMHKIQKRPVAIGNEVVIRPMMYLALSYDHRIVDGREAVSFLVRIKECIEDPQRIMLDV
jgi:2-oxoglutarate dehydrogenase E2 component (dihydrolipoamide succinyltransferase)